MGALKAFDIHIYKLSNKIHDYQYDIDDKFFQAFENSLIQKGHGSCQVTLDKRDNLLTFDFEGKFEVELTCDRSLDLFYRPVSIQEQLLVKYGAEEQELDDNVLVITPETQKINIAQYLYEFISLAVPMKKLHPRFEEEEDSEEYGKMVYSSQQTEEEQDHDVDIDQTDPRWEALKKLKS